jgi:ketosteroid isomerase-like protein
MKIDDAAVLRDVAEVFHAYEKALMNDDLDALDNLFYDAPTTVRYGPSEALYGAQAIRNYRRGRGGSPQRELVRVTITSFGTDFAVVNAEFARVGSDRRGRQSQTWVRFEHGWKVVAAHVSLRED